MKCHYLYLYLFSTPNISIQICFWNYPSMDGLDNLEQETFSLKSYLLPQACIVQTEILHQALPNSVPLSRSGQSDGSVPSGDQSGKFTRLGHFHGAYV